VTRLHVLFGLLHDSVVG